jgi:uncharacterized protein
MHYILFYDVVDDYIARRAQFRKEHLTLVRESFDGGDMVMSGALDDPPDGAVFVFRSALAAETFPKNDPYVKNGLVKSWRVRKLNTVVGDGAVMPA